MEGRDRSALDDAGFDYSVLTYWRARLRRSDRPERVFDAVRAVVVETGVLTGKTRRALDSTLLDDAVATQDTVTQLISAIRRVRRVVPAAAVVAVGAHDYDHAGKPTIAWDDPVAKDALVTGLVNDTLAILAALEDVTLTGEEADAVGLLALVAGQDVEPGDGEGAWRIAQRVAPDRVISTVDPDARHMHKSVSTYRDGYKAHIAVEPETGLITAATVTPANVGDGPTGVALLAGEKPGLQVLGDSAYGGGDTRAALRAAEQEQAIKAIPIRPTVPGGFDRDDFVVDHDARTVTCPNGVTVTITDKETRPSACAARSPAARTMHDPRRRTYAPHRRRRRRTRRRTPRLRDGDFAADDLQWRPMVQRSIAWLVADGHRRVGYRGSEPQPTRPVDACRRDQPAPPAPRLTRAQPRGSCRYVRARERQQGTTTRPKPPGRPALLETGSSVGHGPRPGCEPTTRKTDSSTVS